MATRRPLVLNDGLVSELLDGDTVRAGTSTTEVVAGSGLTGGGSVSTNPELDLALAPNPSGIIYVGDALGIDGAAGVTADIALASGSAAAVLASNALASGNNSLVVASAALASGNAALDLVPTLGGGGGGTVVELTAASAVASGYAVGFDDGGNVQSVRSVVTDNTNPMSFPSAAVVFESASSIYTSTTYDSTNNKIIIAYRDGGNSNYGTAIVGTVSGTSISFGTAVVFESATSSYISTTYDPTNNKVVIAYRDLGNSAYGTAIVGTVSGTSISFGTAVVFESADSTYISTTYDSTNNKIIIAYRDGGNSNYGTAIVGTVSGTSISFGTAVVFESATSSYISTTYDPTNNKVVIAYRDAGNSSYGTAIVGTVSGTSISFGTPVVFETAEANFISTTYDTTNNKIVIAYRDVGNFGYGTAIVGTVSGTSISFGTAVVFESADSSNISTTYDTTNNKVVIAYTDSGNSSYGTAIVGTVSGTSISFGTAVVFESATSSYISTTYDTTNNKVVIAYQDGGNSSYGTAIVADALLSYSYNPTINSYPNVLGIAQSTVASGSPCLVNLPGTLYNEPAANLTTGAFYYANPTTSGITTTSTQATSWDGQVPWNYIGRAVTSSGLMLLKSI
jgi:hypothetical protein